jgi:hypothetical protein
MDPTTDGNLQPGEFRHLHHHEAVKRATDSNCPLTSIKDSECDPAPIGGDYSAVAAAGAHGTQPACFGENAALD